MVVALDDVHVRHLDELRARPAVIDDEGLRLGDTYVMFHAEGALMAEHARRLVGDRPSADVLEVGLGLGVFAAQLHAFGPRSYVGVEPHHSVADLVTPKVRAALSCPVHVLVEPWQSLTITPDSVDAIMYDTWPPEGHADADFAAFVANVAIPALRPGGRFSFFHSGTALPAARAAVLDQHFSSWSATGYILPPDRTPTAWTKPTRDFLIPVAEKGA
jgi:spermidine synthase